MCEKSEGGGRRRASCAAQSTYSAFDRYNFFILCPREGKLNFLLLLAAAWNLFHVMCEKSEGGGRRRASCAAQSTYSAFDRYNFFILCPREGKLNFLLLLAAAWNLFHVMCEKSEGGGRRRASCAAQSTYSAFDRYNFFILCPREGKLNFLLLLAAAWNLFHVMCEKSEGGGRRRASCAAQSTYSAFDRYNFFILCPREGKLNFLLLLAAAWNLFHVMCEKSEGGGRRRASCAAQSTYSAFDRYNFFILCPREGKLNFLLLLAAAWNLFHVMCEKSEGGGRRRASCAAQSTYSAFDRYNFFILCPREGKQI
ncbi:hypothetical protein Tcan_05829 [Toxocara canis]|uniref:Uncharacterized protein n=1 Tax=Toxocara canis TaxID=6265 RepID=A0A0B2VWE8_TOXCA|nr:hypothetical protein Tcan_05829 [Toxocara canis]